MKAGRIYLGILFLVALAQGTANAQFIDTACVNEKHAMYRTGPRAGSVFLWTVEGGVIDSTSADGSRIWVNWGPIGGIRRIILKEITANGCPGDPVDALVLVWPIGPVDIFGPKEICFGVPAELTAVGGADSYKWNTGDTTPKITVFPHQDTTYSVIGYFGECGTKTSLHDLQVKYRPNADFTYTPDNPEMQDLVQFTYTGTNNVDKWDWLFKEKNRADGTSEEVNPEYTFIEPGIKEVRLTVSNEFGCWDTITKYIVVEAGINIFVPTGFTPNGDGFNNVFIPTYEGIASAEFLIFDRWGEIMFRTLSLTEGWDGRYKGKPVPDGVFVYIIKAVGKDGNNYLVNGTITVLR